MKKGFFKNIVSISKAEISRSKPSMNAGVVIFLLIFIAANAVLVFYSIKAGGESSEQIYTVAVDDLYLVEILGNNNKLHSELYEPSKTYDVVINNAGDLNVTVQNTEKSKAALKAVVDVLKAYNYQMYRLSFQFNEIGFTDLYPVWIELRDIKELEELLKSRKFDSETIGSAAQTEGSQSKIEQFRISLEKQRKTIEVKSIIDSATKKTKYNEVTVPDEIATQMPLKGIFLALLVITPMIFVTTHFNNSFFSEKIDKRASLLFMTPATKFELVAGKTLPYIIASLLLTYPIMLFINPSLKAFFLVGLPLITITLFYFSLNYVIVMLARSFKDLSFLKTSIGSFFIGYLLLPTLFSSLSEISYVSPLTVITKVIGNEAVPLKAYIFSSIPMLLSAFVIFAFFTLIFNDEDFYVTGTIMSKLFAILKHYLHNVQNLFFVSFLMFPMALILESTFLVIVALSVRNIMGPIIMLVVVAAIVEEIIKNMGIFVIYQADLLKKKNPFLLALLSGFGFATAEKAVLLIMVPILIKVHYQIVLVGLFIPFIVHTITCLVFALLMHFLSSKLRKNSYLLFIVPIAIHILYNLLVIYKLKGILS